MAHRVLLNHLKKIPNEQIQIYSNDRSRLPPKLRLPIIPGKPSPIIIFAKQKYYFSYNTEQNSTHCQKNKQNCQQSSKTVFPYSVRFSTKCSI